MSTQNLQNGTTKAQEIKAEKARDAEKQIATLTKKARHLWSQWSSLTRKSALAYWSAGTTLAEVKEYVTKTRRLTGNNWEQWCESNGIAKSSADQAIIVATSLSEAEIESCDSITAAKIACGIVKVKDDVRTTPTTQAAHESAPELEPVTMLKVNEAVRAQPITSATHEPAPEHEPETMLRVLVKINHLLAVAITLPSDDHEAIASEVGKAMEVLSNIGTTTLKVVA
jgi:hypothetical protein